MGIYDHELYGMQIDSKEKVMSVLIQRSFKESLCIEIHKMHDDQMKLYWNKEINIYKIIEYRKNHEFAGSLLDLGKDKGFQEFVKENYPVRCGVLSAEQANKIHGLCQKGLPGSNKERWGLDGFSYNISLGDKEYESWCVVPESWKPFVEVLRMLLDITDIEHKEEYLPTGYNEEIRKRFSSN